MQKMFIRAASTLALAGAMLSPVVAQQRAPIKIGFLAELSGSQATLGQDMLDAFMLVVERNGGELGGYPVQIIREDTQARPDVAAQAVVKLIEKEKTPIIAGITLSNVMMAVHKKVTAEKVFLIGGYAGPSLIAGSQCSPYQFIVSRENSQQAEAMGKYAADKGYKRVVLLGANYQAGKDTLAGFKAGYKGPVVDEIYTPLTQLDFSVELSQIAAHKPDAVFTFYPGALGIGFVRQYRQAGLADRFKLLSVGTVDGLTLPGLREDALGLYSATIWATDSALPASRQFVDDFEKKTGRIPSDLAAASYDSALLLDAAIARVKGNVNDKAAFMNALKNAEYDSVRGKVRFGNNNFPIQDIHIVEVAKDEKNRVSLRRVNTPMVQVADSYHQQCPMK
jgi:branched-chain amino acid transport system substrate-binding protein